MCDLASNVICPGVANVPANSCQPKSGAVSGDVSSPQSCGSFQFCNKGVLDANVETCDPLHFNPDTETCDLPENLGNPCVEPVAAMSSIKSMEFFVAPQPVEIPKAPVLETPFRRINRRFFEK